MILAFSFRSLVFRLALRYLLCRHFMKNSKLLEMFKSIQLGIRHTTFFLETPDHLRQGSMIVN